MILDSCMMQVSCERRDMRVTGILSALNYMNLDLAVYSAIRSQLTFNKPVTMYRCTHLYVLTCVM